MKRLVKVEINKYRHSKYRLIKYPSVFLPLWVYFNENDNDENHIMNLVDF